VKRLLKILPVLAPLVAVLAMLAAPRYAEYRMTRPCSTAKGDYMMLVNGSRFFKCNEEGRWVRVYPPAPSR
jgi:hypothetical protein